MCRCHCCLDIDKRGEWVIKPRFENATEYRHGIAAAEVEGCFGVIDRTGAWIIPPRFPQMDLSCFKWFDDDIEVVAGEDGRWGAIDRSGEWRIQPTFARIVGFSEGLGNAQDEEGLWGLIDKAGNWVLPAQYEAIDTESDDFGIWPITKNWIPVTYRQTLFRKCPRITSVIASKTPRLTGLWDVQPGKPYIVFEDDSCFVQQLSEGGEALANLLGTDSLESSTWTDYSC